jgi:hypothetical protein
MFNVLEMCENIYFIKEHMGKVFGNIWEYTRIRRRRRKKSSLQHTYEINPQGRVFWVV